MSQTNQQSYNSELVMYQIINGQETPITKSMIDSVLQLLIQGCRKTMVKTAA